jgi:Protein of unknown function (DUF2817)
MQIALRDCHVPRYIVSLSLSSLIFSQQIWIFHLCVRLTMATGTTRHFTATAVASAAIAAVAIFYSKSYPRDPSPSWVSKILSATPTPTTPTCPELLDLASGAADSDLPTFFSELKWGTADACQLFSDSYVAARSRFRDAARQVPGARLVSLPVVHLASTNSKSPADDKDDDGATDYTMDLVVLPGTTASGKRPRVVVHTSGVHGVEGYAGSAVQVAFLQLLQNRRWGATTGDRDEGSRPTVVLVHAFNPFGMAHFRRVNENNVDLNRNGIRGTFDDPADDNRRNNYEQFRNLFVPDVAPSVPFGWLWLRQWLLFALEAMRHGIPALKAAMVSGQYHDPAGIFYGGDRVQPSYAVLEQWLVQDLLPSLGVPATSIESKTADGTNRTPFESVMWIDVHTGLGPSGQDTMMPCLPMAPPDSSPDSSILSKIGERFPDAHHPSHGAAGADVASAYGTVRGQVGDYFGDLLRPLVAAEGEATFVAQEFGTIVSPRVGHALIVENALWHHRQQRSDKPVMEMSQWLRHAFYPDDPMWRRSVVTRGLRVLLQAMRA